MKADYVEVVDRHGHANNSDPFAAGRLYTHIRHGIVKDVELTRIASDDLRTINHRREDQLAHGNGIRVPEV